MNIPQGTRCLSIPKACEKLCRGKSWVWDRIKNDPNFPKPVKFAAGRPVMLEHELDAWLAAQVEASRAKAA